MTTKFDIGDVVFIPVRVDKITIYNSSSKAYSPEYRIIPVGQTSSCAMTYFEHALFTREDFLNGKTDKLKS